MILNRLLCLLVIVLAQFYSIDCFYALNKHKTADWEIAHDLVNLSSSSFPNEFTLKFTNRLNQSFDIKFHKRSDNNRTSQLSQSNYNVFFIDNANSVQPRRYAPKRLRYEHEFYSDRDERNFATLIQSTSDQSFRILGKIKSPDGSNAEFDIMPVLDLKRRTKRNAQDVVVLPHAIVKRSAANNTKSNQNVDFMVPPGYVRKNVGPQNESFTPRKRVYQGQPVQLYVETLIVADDKVYRDFKANSGINDEETIIEQMRVYHIHLVNLAGRYYVNSFQNDSDVRITVLPKAYIYSSVPTVWSNPALYSNGQTEADGTPIVENRVVLRKFSDYTKTLNLPVEWDFAFGLTGYSLGDAVGIAWLENICDKYMGFSCGLVEITDRVLHQKTMAHELAHNLGSNHDWDNGCGDRNSPTLMGAGQNYPLSECSKREIKNVVLDPSTGNISKQAKCLANQPSQAQLLPEFNLLPFWPNPGLSLFTADDQCKRENGANSAFAFNLVDETNMCSTPKRCSLDKLEYPITYSNYLADGTVCGRGKICSNRQCVNSSLAPNNECPFGDGFVYKNYRRLVSNDKLPPNTMSCAEYLDVFSLKNNIDPVAECANEGFRRQCCLSCKRYEKVTCKDTNPNCLSWSSRNMCEWLFNDIKIKTLCQKSCKVCNASFSQKCSDSTVPCQNGGTCENISTAQPTDLIGWRCRCPTGFSGAYCQTKDPCLPNPCVNKGRCIPVSSLAYVCSDSLRTTVPPTTQTTTQTTTTTAFGTTGNFNSNCVDTWDVCSDWAKQNYCSARFNDGLFVRDRCPRACNNCGSTTTNSLSTSSCIDQYEYCSIWASNNQCEYIFNDGVLVKNRCRKSCRLC